MKKLSHATYLRKPVVRTLLQRGNCVFGTLDVDSNSYWIIAGVRREFLVHVRLYAILREIAGAREVVVSIGSEGTVRDALHALVQIHPKLTDSIWNEDGSVAGHVAVVLNGRDIRHQEGIDTPVTDADILSLFPPVGGGGGEESLTCIRLRFAGDLHGRVGQSRIEFGFKGNTLRELIPAVVEKFDLADLLMAGDEPKPYLQIVIDGRLWYTVGGWEAEIREGSMVALIIFGGALKPISIPLETTLGNLSSQSD